MNSLLDYTSPDIEVLQSRINELESEISRLQSIVKQYGHDNVEYIRHKNNDWTILIHRKDKNTHKIRTVTIIIKNSNVLTLLYIIQEFSKKNPIVSYSDVVLGIIIEYGIENKIRIDDFNGGRNRTRYYFPLYYYPMKVLEHMGLVRYNRNQIKLIK